MQTPGINPATTLAIVKDLGTRGGVSRPAYSSPQRRRGSPTTRLYCLAAILTAAAVLSAVVLHLLGANDIGFVLSEVLVLLAQLAAVAALMALCWPLVRDVNRRVSLPAAGAGLGSGLVLVGLVLVQGSVDPPETAFYEVGAQVMAALVVAFAVSAHLRPSRDADIRRAQAGMLLAVIGLLLVGIAAASIAVARDDGSAVLFALTAVSAAYAALLLCASAVVRIVDIR
jgi:hypothetical protein